LSQAGFARRKRQSQAHNAIGWFRKSVYSTLVNAPDWQLSPAGIRRKRRKGRKIFCALQMDLFAIEKKVGASLNWSAQF
jgi:hypothetical protein